MFLQAEFFGRRFEDHSIPLKMVAKLPVLQQIFDILIEIEVQESFGAANAKSMAKLKGTLVLDGLGNTSAVANIDIGTIGKSPQLADDNDVANIYANARARFYDCINTVNNAENGFEGDEWSKLPADVLERLTKLGSGLTSDEGIEFRDSVSQSGAKLNKQTFKRLKQLLDKPPQDSEKFSLIVKIPEVNLLTKSFAFLARNGSTGRASFLPEHESQVKQSFLDFENDAEVEIHGEGIVDKKSGSVKDATIEDITVVDNRNTVDRLKEFKTLRDGWMDGLGLAPKPKALQWLINQVRKYFPKEMQQPYCYPTPKGGVQMEWSIGEMEVSLEINLDTRLAEFHGLNVNSKTEFKDSLEIDDSTTWKTVVNKIGTISKEVHG